MKNYILAALFLCLGTLPSGADYKRSLNADQRREFVRYEIELRKAMSVVSRNAPEHFGFVHVRLKVHPNGRIEVRRIKGAPAKMESYFKTALPKMNLGPLPNWIREPLILNVPINFRAWM